MLIFTRVMVQIIFFFFFFGCNYQILTIKKIPIKKKKNNKKDVECVAHMIPTHTCWNSSINELVSTSSSQPSATMSLNQTQACGTHWRVWKRVFWAQPSMDAALPNPQLLKA